MNIFVFLQLTPWNVDTLCHDGKSKTVSNKNFKIVGGDHIRVRLSNDKLVPGTCWEESF